MTCPRVSLTRPRPSIAKVIKIDFDNPYANNNMAVLMEKQGKLIGRHDVSEYWRKICRAVCIQGGYGLSYSAVFVRP